jgi:hypothetical protein
MNGRVYWYKNGKMNGISSQGDGPRRLGRPGAPPRQAPPAGATTSCRRLWQPRQRRRVLAAVSARGGRARRHALPAARLPRDAMARRPRGVRRPRGGPTSSPAGRPLAGRRCCSAAAFGWTHSAASSGSPDRSTASTAAASRRAIHVYIRQGHGRVQGAQAALQAGTEHRVLMSIFLPDARAAASQRHGGRGHRAPSLASCATLCPRNGYWRLSSRPSSRSPTRLRLQARQGSTGDGAPPTLLQGHGEPARHAGDGR